MKTQITLAGLLALAACGGASTGTSPSGMPAGDAAAYEGSALSLSAAVTAYQDAAQTMSTPAQCQAAVQQYGTAMTAALAQVRARAGAVDQAFQAAGDPAAADATCGATVMADRLRLHLAEACTTGDMTRERARAQDHLREMTQDAAHVEMRAAGLCDGTCDATCQGCTASGDQTQTQTRDCDGGTCDGGTCDATCDGSMSRDRIRDAGYTTSDGQHLGWDEPMPGCTYRNGQYEATPSASPSTPAG